MASHDLDEVERLSDVVLVFAEGEVVARGSYREVESAAAALFDAERQREGL
jgi:ABC-type Na+ transport system ATPase subunit NatA